MIRNYPFEYEEVITRNVNGIIFLCDVSCGVPGAEGNGPDRRGPPRLRRSDGVQQPPQLRRQGKAARHSRGGGVSDEDIS